MRPRVLTALAVLDFVWAALALAPAAVVASRLARHDANASLLAATGVCALVAGIAVIAGVGLLCLEEYGRRVQLGLAALAVPLVPLGTLVALLLYLYLTKPWTRLLFAGAGAALEPIGTETQGRAKEHGLALAAVVVGFIVAGLVALGLLAVLLARLG